MRINPTHEKLSYSGRIDWTNQEAPVFVYPSTSVTMRFTGNILHAFVENHRAYWNNFIGCILDGEQQSFLLGEQGKETWDIPVREKERQVHEVLLFKRQDACHEVGFLGFEIEEGAQILDPPSKPYRKMEVYGDSVSVGDVAEAVDYTGKEDPPHSGEYTNSWYSYAWMTARKLNAEIYNISQGGAALMDGTGWFHDPDTIGMETIWDKIRYNPELGPAMRWNFSEYCPQLVIVEIGQNDSRPTDYMKDDFYGECAENWRAHYRAFLRKIRQVYPEAYIICCMTILYHDAGWDRSIGMVVQELQDPKITQYLFRKNGVGTPGHVRISEAEEMAEELKQYIEGLAIEGWNA